MKQTSTALYAVTILATVGALAIAHYARIGTAPHPRYAAARYPHRLQGKDLALALGHAGKPAVPLPNGGFRLYASTAFHYQFEMPDKQQVPIYIVARGTSVNDVFPFIAVHVSGAAPQSFYCTSTDWGLYRLDFKLARGWHRATVSYLNNELHMGESRNLDIRSLHVGAPPPDAAALVRWPTPVHLPATRMAYAFRTQHDHDARRLWSDGTMADDFHFAHTDSIPVFVRLGRNSNSTSRLQVQLDGLVLGEYDVDGNAPETIGLTARVTPGQHRLTLKNIALSPARQNDIRVRDIYVNQPPPSEPVSDPFVVKAGAELPWWDFDPTSRGSAGNGEWGLWEPGHLRKRIICTTDIDLTATLVARGTPALGIWPQALLLLDGAPIADFHVSASNHAAYTQPINIPAGRHHLDIYYNNDGFVVEDGSDRNLFIKSLRFEAPVDP